LLLAVAARAARAAKWAANWAANAADDDQIFTAIDFALGKEKKLPGKWTPVSKICK